MSDEFEANGTVTVTIGSLIADRSSSPALTWTEVYSWNPTNADEVLAFGDAVKALSSVPDGTLTIRDFVPGAAVTTRTGSGTSVEAEASLGEATGQATAAGVVTGSGTAVEAEGSLGEATGQATAAGVVTGSGTAVEVEGSLGEATGQAISVVVLLLLSDSDDAGLAVVAKALLVASAAGTSGNNLYADSDRGGTDTPLDGELGLGDDETVISRIRRFSATELNFNDNDSPATLDIGVLLRCGRRRERPDDLPANRE